MTREQDTAPDEIKHLLESGEKESADDVKRLKDSQRDLARAEAIAQIGSWRLDLRTQKITASDQARRIYGLDGNQWSMEQVQALPLKEYRQALDAQLKDLIEKGAPYQIEFQILRPSDGALRHIFSMAEFDPEPRMVVGTLQDITERKQGEEERAKLQSQLNQARKMEAVGRLAGGVAHDFNNMLSVILGFAELAMEKAAPSDPLHNDLQEIIKAAERSAAMVKQLLAFARKQTIAPRVLDLNEAIEAMLKILRRLIGEDIDLAWLPETGLWPVKMDPSQIDQILTNLCVNGRDAIGGVGRIAIETGKTSMDENYCRDHAGFTPGDFVFLAVSDNGCGMNRQTRDNLFEPFFTTKGEGEGSGMGLATVYGIVKQNNGFINVYSEPGKGTIFKIYLPCHGAEAETLPGIVSTEPLAMGNETILLVEDEQAILKMTAAMLEAQGYTVLTANSTGEALTLGQTHSGEIHLLITDVIMPDMSGRDLAEHLILLHPDMKILFMSGYTANVIAHHGVLDEGVHFIQKPFSRRDIAMKAREVLDSKQDKNSQVLET